MRLFHRSISLFASLLLFHAYIGIAQQFNFSLVSSPTESPWGLVKGITQDNNGVMWFVTDNGLHKYDGYTITTYLNEPQNPNSIAQNNVECIYIDSDGIIWLGMFNSGLDRFDPATKSFTHYQHNIEDTASLIGNEIRAILEDSEGILWVGTLQGLCSLNRNTGKFKQYKSNEDDGTTLSDNMVKAIYEDSQGTLWIGTGETWGPTDFLKGGLNRFERKTDKFTRFMHDPNDPHSLIDNRVRAICEDSRGNFWVGTAGDGLHLMDREKGTFQRLSYDPKHPEKLSRPVLSPAPMLGAIDHITFIREDATGAIWIGTMGAGVNRYDPNTKKVTHYGGDATSGGLKDEKTWWSYLSRDGVFWISCLQGNLYHVDPSQVLIPSFNTDPSLFGIFQNDPRQLWENTSLGLIQKDLRTGSRKLFNQDSFIDTITNFTNITCITADHQSVVWVGTFSAGLHHYNPDTHKFIQYRHNPDDERSLDGDRVFSILEDRAYNLWVGTGRGLNMLDRKTGYFTHYQNNPADSSSLFAPYSVTAIMEDEDQNHLWVGAFQGGINRLNKQTGKFNHYRRNDIVNEIIKDHEGVIWVATNAGLFKFNQQENNFEKFKDPTGYIEVNYADGVTLDNQNNLWLNRRNGILQIKKNREQIVQYNRNNGVYTANFYSGEPFKDLNGKLYFPFYPSGYYSFFPDSLPQQHTSPLISIADFKLGSGSLEHEVGRYLNAPVNEVTEINLSYDQNVFTFDFIPIHYSSPEDNRVVFKLENYDKVWRKPGSEKTAQYYNVPPGRYTFRIKASTNMGIYTERAITVYIAPPWWRSWWAYAIYGILLIGGIFMVDRIQRKRLLAKAHEEAREIELEQAREIEKAYKELKVTQSQLIQSEKMASLGELTAGIAHEIQNPLNFVNNFSEVNTELIEELKAERSKVTGERDEKLEEEILNDLEENEGKIKHHGQRAEGIVKGMLQHSRTSQGEKELTDINALADEYLRLAYHGLRAKDKSFNADFKTDFDKTLPMINVIPQDIGRVLLNLINNAFYAVDKKAKEGIEGYQPLVEISAKKHSKSIDICVKDNGPGIQEQVRDKIFQPFFTTKPTGSGAGLGLSLSYDIIKAHGGELKVESVVEKGSKFIIVIPQKIN